MRKLLIALLLMPPLMASATTIAQSMTFSPSFKHLQISQYATDIVPHNDTYDNMSFRSPASYKDPYFSEADTYFMECTGYNWEVTATCEVKFHTNITWSDDSGNYHSCLIEVNLMLKRFQATLEGDTQKHHNKWCSGDCSVSGNHLWIVTPNYN